MNRPLQCAMCWALLVFLPAGFQVASAQEKPKPVDVPLKAKLVNKKDAYKLDLGGKSGAEFRKLVAEARKSGIEPKTPTVDMVLELTNTSNHELKFTIGGDGNAVGLNITGDGVVFYPTDPRDPITTELRLGTVVTLAAGKTYALPITSLRSGFRGLNRAYWTEPGEYKVTASFTTPISPAPKGAEKAFASALVASEPIKVKVETQEKNPNVNLYSEPCAPGVPVPASPEGVSAFQLTVTMSDKGEGHGKVTLDPNPLTYDEFGRLEATTNKALLNVECSVKFVKKGAFTETGPLPTKYERFLYEIQGKNLSGRLFLVTVAKLGAEPLKDQAWLLVKDKQGKVTNLVRMYPPAHPSPIPCHPGCFPVGTLVETPKGAKAIDSLRAGDVVTIVRPDGASEPGKVNSIFITPNRLLKVETTEGHVLFTTETQPLCSIDGAMKGAGELKAGDKIYRWQDGKRQVATVRAVTTTDRVEKVFNLILGDSEVFIAGGFLARSKPPALALESTRQLSAPALPGSRK